MPFRVDYGVNEKNLNVKNMNLSVVPNSDLENRRIPRKNNWLFSTQALHVNMTPQTFKSDQKTLPSNAFNNGDPLRRRPRPH